MARDYFQDILPPEDGPVPGRDGREVPETEETQVPIRVGDTQGMRSIRNIPAPNRLHRRMGGDMRDAPHPGMPAPRTRRSGWLMWLLAGLSLVVIAGVLLVALRSTTVTVTPKSHQVVFDQTSQFTAYPAASAAQGTLSYSIQTSDLEDSQVVPAQGTTTTPAVKASGTITVYNSYSDSSVRLVKNTRFQSLDGFVFRVPADVVVPGRKGSAAGHIDVTVIADQAGVRYNIAPADHFTLPGLKSNPAMYTGVYAKSSSAMSGGSDAGSGPAVAPADMTAAIASMHSRLESKARAAAANDASTFVFPDLIQIAYQDRPSTAEAGGGVRLHETAHVVTIVFPSDQLAQTIARAVSAEADNAPVTLLPGKNFGATLSGATTITGLDPIQFLLTGQALLVWKVDAQSLASALAGKDQGAFQTIVNGFPSVQEARARVEPFWKTTFPANPASIKINVQTLSAS